MFPDQARFAALKIVDLQDWLSKAGGWAKMNWPDFDQAYARFQNIHRAGLAPMPEQKPGRTSSNKSSPEERAMPSVHPLDLDQDSTARSGGSRLLLQPVESVMSRSFSSPMFTGYPRLRSVAALAADAPQPLPEPPSLTPQQQLALFTLLRTEIAREIVATLKASTVLAGANEYSHLVTLGWAQRKPGSIFHEITINGKFQADRLAKLAAKELDLHIFTTSGARFQTSVSCSCGWSYFSQPQ